MKKLYEFLFCASLISIIGIAGGYELERIGFVEMIIAEVSSLVVLVLSYLGANNDE